MGARMLDILLHGVSTRNYKASHPRDGGDGGRVALGGEPGSDRGLRSRGGSAAQPAFRRAETAGDLHRRAHLRRLHHDRRGGRGCGRQQACAGHPRRRHGKLHGSDRTAGRHRGARRRSQRKMLFVIDGSKALRAAINAVFGSHQPVQRCRAHKLRNVLDYLSKDDKAAGQKPAARGLEARAPKEGMARIKKLAAWLDQKYPSGGGQSAGRPGRVLHHQPAGSPAVAAPLPGHHQHHREPARRSAHPDPPRDSLAERQHGLALDGLGFPPNREALQTHHGTPRSVALDAILNPLRPPAKRRRSNINLTAARHFQLRAGHAQ